VNRALLAAVAIVLDGRKNGYVSNDFQNSILKLMIPIDSFDVTVPFVQSCLCL